MHNLSFDFFQKNNSSLQAIRKYSQLREILLRYPSVMLAYSGGVDSTFLLAAWQDAWRQENIFSTAKKPIEKKPTAIANREQKPRLLACTFLTPLLPDGTAEEVEKLVQLIGAEHRFIEMNPLEESFMQDNKIDRCYHCKAHLFSHLLSLAQEEKLTCLMDGTNIDDFNDYRPGHRALQELSVVSPLAEVALTKAEIRTLSKAMALPTWDQPSMACLASRIPYGTAIDKIKLEQVDRAEKILVEFGFVGSRVRHHGDIARLEIAGDLTQKATRLFYEPLRSHLINAFKNIGFRYIAIDLEGYQTGSLNPTNESIANS
ncbi:ATP-dependent sacrificial sulfur transferase LarE [Heliorestis acidaminivorans]|uniref:ATP-dependent sacrificial sulfur transferase LarE n=1 Tax=Heliorestis acidaminivorans TaxID=553427 RepID=A0A6I0F501_9FIRM|nr:ATP-dependent sacrificial sulfur transferase LarE [Heliorestis acidaminivorans]KAB2953912.1 ATP-dependent sacrificial sulfur transferase LarE [Heliorestis acidaminivorans]